MSVELISSMLDLQNQLNKRIHPTWQAQNFRWDTAVWVECAECMDHLGYKWWSHQEPDIDQVKLELVDIWHFGMSYMLTCVDDIGNLTRFIDSKLKDVPTDGEFDVDKFKDHLEILVAKITTVEASPEFSIYNFFAMWFNLGLTLEDMYKYYIGKNALNAFRQLNGYKQGTYIKQWFGEEDNVHLSKLLDTAVVNTNLYDYILNELGTIYSGVANVQ
jgi:dimeric dUTPase (all-alpha-NTP-PPase superfamily)